MDYDRGYDSNYSKQNYKLNCVILCVVIISLCMNIPIVLNSVNSLCMQYVDNCHTEVTEWLKR